MDDIVMSGDDQPQPSRRGPGPRLYHKKSRMGCLRCKARRVKCDEAWPACAGCSRHQVECVYPSVPPNTTASRGPSTPQRLLPVQPAEPSSGSGNDVNLWITSHESSSGQSEQGFAPRPSPTTLSPHHVDAWVTAPTPEPPFLSVPSHRGDFSGLTIMSQSAAPSMLSLSVPVPRPTPPMPWGGQSSASGWPGSGSTKAPSVVSNSSSSFSGGSLFVEANNYLSHLTDPDILEIPESRERRMWELKLMHNFVQSQAQQFAKAKSTAHHGEQPTPGVALQDSDLDPNNPDSKNVFGDFIWAREIPKLAFENDTILYSMLASSALDMWSKATDPQEKEQLHLFHQKYLSMAMREQRLAVGTLSRANADLTCIAALTILQNSSALVQLLPWRPWQPPLDWLRMGKGAGAVLIVARGYLGFGGSGGDELITRFLRSTPRLDPEELFAAENRAHLGWLLDNDGGSTDNVGDYELEGNDVTLEIYNKVLSFIGYMQKCIAAKEPLYMVLRRLIGFSIYMPELYHEFLAQRRPRAMITLAHFFKLWIPYDDLWQIGKTGENQIRGIYEELPREWKHKVEGIFEEYGLEP